MIRPSAKSVLDELLTSATRARLLTIFLTHPGEDYYVRELYRRSGQSLRAVQHELARLERLGLLIANRRGRQKFYKVNENHPLFDDLKRIVYKTAAMGDLLRDTLEGIRGVDAAFIYGSVAKGKESISSDLDLMVVGAPDSSELDKAIRSAEENLNREISLNVMSKDEWHARRMARDAFVSELLKSDKIFLISDERALRRA